MPQFFRNAPIQRKLMLIILGSCAAALIVAAMVEAGFRLFTERNNFRRDVGMLARVVASHTTAAVAFKDKTAVQEVLASLRENPAVRSAGIWLPDGHLLCDYGESDTLSWQECQETQSGAVFDGLMLRHLEPLVIDGQQVGMLSVRADARPALRSAARSEGVLLVAVICISVFTAYVVSRRLQKSISTPIRRLADTAGRIALHKDYSLRVEKFSADEVGAFTEVFNYMLGEIEQHNTTMQREIAERIRAEQEVDKLHRQVLAASRQAGMAEVATGVLHNVGNVLNSVNVSAALLNEQLEKSRGTNVTRIAHLLQSRMGDLATFFTTDPKGRVLPEYLGELGQRLDAERLKMRAELQGLSANIEHIKEIVNMQQSYAKHSDVTETLPAADLAEDALRMNAAAFTRHKVTLQRDYAEALPCVAVDKHKVLQILTNLLRNAKDAMEVIEEGQKLLSVGIGLEGAGFVAISITDNGVGIPQENLTRIFAHGFTTRKDGHGFGLHSSANAAKEMGGTLTARSAGTGRGATFTLTLPISTSPPLSTDSEVCPPTARPLTAAS